MNKKRQHIISIEVDEEHLPIPSEEDMACLDAVFAAPPSQIDYSDIPYTEPKNAYRPGKTEKWSKDKELTRLFFET
jgi:hypothetical protein